MKEHVEKHKDGYERYGRGTEQVINGRHFLAVRRTEELNEDNDDWDGAPPTADLLEGTRTREEREQTVADMSRVVPSREAIETMHLEPEPQLTIDQ